MQAVKINWDFIRRYTSPQAMKDLDRFLDAIPLVVGYNALIAAGLMWLFAAGAVLFTARETEKVSQMHTDLMQIQALQPPIPVLIYTPVDPTTLKNLAAKTTATFKGITVLGTGSGDITITAQDTDYFPQFVSAIGYIQRGGKNWKVKIASMCVGRLCPAAKLSVKLRIEAVRFGEPPKPEEGASAAPADAAKK